MRSDQSPTWRRTTHDLRCFCRRRPLLALYGIDANGERYIEIKVYKQQQTYGHAVVTLTDGNVKIFCRECHRWYVVSVRPDDIAVLQEIPSLTQEESPAVQIP